MRLVNAFRSPLAREPQFDLDPVVADVLSVPAVKEVELLDGLARLGADDSVLKAGLVFARAREALLDAYADEPAEVRKQMQDALDDLMGEDGDAAANGELEDADDLEETRDEGSEMLTPGAIAKMSPSDRLALSDAYDRVALDWAVDRIRKADPGLTREQAVAKALEQDPSLRDRAQRAYEAEAAKPERPSDAVAKAERHQARLDRATQKIRAREPGLSPLAAVRKALDEDPSLYEAP